MKVALNTAFRYLTNAQIGFLALIFTLPLYRGFFGVLIGIIIGGSLIRLRKSGAVHNFKIDWFLPGLFAYYMVSGLLTGEPFPVMEKRIALLVVPLMFALNFNLFDRAFRNRVLSTFILGNLLAVATCLARAVVRSIRLTDGTWSFNSRVYTDQTFDVFTSSVMGGNHFFGSELSYFIDQPTYFSIYLILAQAFIYVLYRDLKRTRIRITLIAFYVLFSAALFLLSGKATLITFFALTVYIVSSMTKSRVMKPVVIVAALLAGIVFFSVNPRSKVFLETVTSSLEKVDPNAKYGHSLRLLSWDSSLDVIKNNWLFGVGEGNKETRLLSVYKQKNYVFPAERRYNTHNQYLDFLLGGGVVLLGFFLFGITRLAVSAVKKRNELLLIFLAIITFNLLFENLLSRHSGIVIFAIFVCYLAGVHKDFNEVPRIDEKVNT